MKNTLIIALVLATLGFGGWTVYANMQDTPTDGKKPGKATPYFEWSFVGAGEDAQGIPHTAVKLSSNGHMYDLGTYAGSCSAIGDSSWPLIDGEVDGAICWFAGGGDELGIFKEGDNFIVKKGQLDEGSAEIPGTRGNFTLLVTLEEM